ncbi:MAG TPA: GNAT family N-acetyltransferase [Edaphobacter sp.]|nr:GNAT family N-acetyltransferase [Edaphobacter sp.]
MPEKHTFRLICQTCELEEFRPAWQMLWQQDRNATPFQSPEWLLPWWHQFGQPELRAIAILNYGKPIALLPFYIYYEPDRRERQLLLMGVGTSDYLDGIFAPECRIEHIHFAFEHLHEMDGWDVMYVTQLRESSILHRALKQINGWDDRSFGTESCSQMRASPVSELPVKIRRNAMYYRNRALRLGTLELTLANEEDWPLAFNALVNLHTARWQKNGESGVLADPRVLACHREAIPQLLRLGILRLGVLRLNGEVLGVAYALVDPVEGATRTQYIYLMSHSIEHAQLRPGTLLLAAMTEHAANEGVQTIDLLRGEESYKRLWHVESIPTFGFSFDYTANLSERRLLSA